jgi:hypothetical protein
MVTFIIIIIILYFIFKSDEPNDQNTSKQPEYKNSSVTKNNLPQRSQRQSTTAKNTLSHTPQSHNVSNRVDLKINGNDLVNGDIVTMRSGNTFKVIEKNANGTLTGINIRTNEKISLFATQQDRFTLMNGIYVHEIVVNHPKQTAKILQKDNVTCPSCKKSNNSYTRVCSSCGWKLSSPYVYRKVRLAGVTYENRQSLLARMSIYDKLSIRRDRNNRYDRNAIGVYTSQNQNIGWVPKDIATYLAPIMDSGTNLSVKVLKKIGGNGYNFGLEVIISNDAEKLKVTPIDEATPSSTHKSSSYVASSVNTNRNGYLDDEDEDYRPTYGSTGYVDSDYDDYERNRDYEDFDEEAQGWEDLWEYNQNH